MMGPFESQCEQILAEGVSVFEFTKASVKKLRTDYFMLMRNLPRVKTQKDVEFLREAIVKFRGYLESMFDPSRGFGSGSVVKAIENFIYKLHPGDYATAKHVIDGRVGLIKSHAWQLSMELDIEFESDRRFSRFGDKNLYNDIRDRQDGPIFNPRKVKNYRQRVGKKAKGFFDVLGYFLEWAGKQSEETFTIRQPVNVTNEIHGFKVVLHGYDPKGLEYKRGPKLKAGYDTLVAGLKIYRRNTAKRFPQMLKQTLPLFASFACGMSDGGRYEHRLIRACPMAYKGDPTEFAHVIAHEMGHHLWRSMVKSPLQTWWRKIIAGDYKSLDLRKVLANWGDDDWVHQVSDRLKLSDPVLSLQLEIINNFEGLPQGRQFKGLDKREGFQAALDSGRKVILPQHPVTAYAHKNPEEAFCEVAGLWVSRGRKAVHPMVMANFKYILGL